MVLILFDTLGEGFYYLLELGFGKPHRAQETQGKQQLSALRVHVVNLAITHPPGRN